MLRETHIKVEDSDVFVTICIICKDPTVVGSRKYRRCIGCAYKPLEIKIKCIDCKKVVPAFSKTRKRCGSCNIDIGRKRRGVDKS